MDVFFVAVSDAKGSPQLPTVRGPFVSQADADEALAKSPLSAVYRVYRGSAVKDVSVQLNAPTITAV